MKFGDKMQLDRAEFLKAVDFLKPVIGSDKNTGDWKNHVHVSIDGITCTLTAGNTQQGRRVVLEKPDIPIDIEADQIEDNRDIVEQYDFLINRPNLESFVTLCRKHKAKFEGAAKKDLTLRFIDIFSDQLESHKTTIRYMQPIGVVFPDKKHLFHSEEFTPNKIQINTDHMIDVIKGFETNAYFYFGTGEFPLSIQSPCKSRLAYVFYQVPEDE